MQTLTNSTSSGIKFTNTHTQSYFDTWQSGANFAWTICSNVILFKYSVLSGLSICTTPSIWLLTQGVITIFELMASQNVNTKTLTNIYLSHNTVNIWDFQPILHPVPTLKILDHKFLWFMWKWITRKIEYNCYANDSFIWDTKLFHCRRSFGIFFCLFNHNTLYI